jgi:hypothetical protein
VVFVQSSPLYDRTILLECQHDLSQQPGTVAIERINSSSVDCQRTSRRSR